MRTFCTFLFQTGLTSLTLTVLSIMPADTTMPMAFLACRVAACVGCHVASVAIVSRLQWNIPKRRRAGLELGLLPRNHEAKATEPRRRGEVGLLFCLEEAIRCARSISVKGNVEALSNFFRVRARSTAPGDDFHARPQRAPADYFDFDFDVDLPRTVRQYNMVNFHIVTGYDTFKLVENSKPFLSSPRPYKLRSRSSTLQLCCL